MRSQKKTISQITTLRKTTRFILKWKKWRIRIISSTSMIYSRQSLRTCGRHNSGPQSPSTLPPSTTFRQKSKSGSWSMRKSPAWQMTFAKGFSRSCDCWMVSWLSDAYWCLLIDLGKEISVSQLWYCKIQFDALEQRSQPASQDIPHLLEERYEQIRERRKRERKDRKNGQEVWTGYGWSQILR